MYRASLLSSLALLAALALAEGASAAIFCVTPEASCPPAQTFSALQPALDAANGNSSDDTIRLGAATYTAPSADGFQYLSGLDEALEIAGKGPTTVLTGAAGAQYVLHTSAPGAKSSVHDLRVHMPASMQDVGSGVISGGFDYSHVTVDEDANQSHERSGVLMFSGTFHDSTVTLADPVTPQTAGVELGGASAAVTDSNVTGSLGVVAAHGTVDRVSVVARTTGIFFSNDAVVRNSLVRLVASNVVQQGIVVGNDLAAKLSNCTVIGSGSSASRGIHAYANTNTDTNLEVAGVVIHGFDHALYREANPGYSTTITIHHSDYDPANLGASGSGSIVEGAGNAFHADPGFFNVSVGDYSLEDNSPLIDRGDPAADFGATDRDGHVRVFDGDGDGSAAPDIGAYEYGAPAPGSGGGGGAPADAGAGPSDIAVGAPSSNDARAPGATSPDAGSSLDRRAPGLSRIRLGARWLRLTLDEAALVEVRIAHRTRTGLHLVRHLRVNAKAAGALKIALGRLHGRRYRLVISATDAAGNHSAPIARGLVRH